MHQIFVVLQGDCSNLVIGTDESRKTGRGTYIKRPKLIVRTIQRLNCSEAFDVQCLKFVPVDKNLLQFWTMAKIKGLQFIEADIDSLKVSELHNANQ